MTGNSPSAAQAAERYGGVARWFHWAIAAMIVLQFVLAKLGDIAEDDGERLRQLALLANHKSVGMTVLMLAVLRIVWRLFNAPPPLPAQMANWQRIASHISHWSLYALLFSLPISGWLMSSASAYSVSWFGLFTWPDLVEPSKALRATLHDVHELLGEALFVIALLHIAAALKHHWIDRDDVLRRMSSWPSLAAFAVIIAAGLFALTDTGPGKPAGTAAETRTSELAAPAVSASGDELADAGAVTDGKDQATQAAKDVPADDVAAPGGDEHTDADGKPSGAAAADVADDAAGAKAGLALNDRDENATAAEKPQAATAREDDAAAPTTEKPQTPELSSINGVVPTSTTQGGSTGKQRDASASEPAQPPSAPRWLVDYDSSTIRFTAEQAGAQFTGEWQQWRADMRFAADALDDSAFVVTIEVRGVETRDDDRDSTLMEDEWFAAADYPSVVFRSGAMRASDDGFATDATLEVKGARKPIVFTFAVTADGDQRRLTGGARLDRLALGIGTGEWTDTEWVGQFVDVNVVVNATLQ